MATRGRPRKTETDAPAEAVENISDDQLQALFFQSKRDYEKALDIKKTADADFKICCERIKAELGKRGIAEIKLAIALGDPNGEDEAKADIESTIRIMKWMGVAIGTQADLFPDVDPAPATERAFNEGKRQGLAGETQSNPHHHSFPAHQAHNDGYAEGQGVLASGIKPLMRGAPMSEWDQEIKSDAIDSLAGN